MIRLPLWSAIVPAYGEKGIQLVDNCLASLQHSNERHEVIVVDDGSPAMIQGKLAQICESFGANFIAQPENGGFAKACNAGIQAANGAVVILFNDDCRQSGKTLDNLANFTLFTNAATVGCKLLYRDNTIQHAGVYYVPAQPHGYWDHVGRFEDRFVNYACRIRRSLCTGACLAINRYVFDSVGFLDERYGMAVEDLDLQMRCIETGYATFYCGLIEAYHLEGQTRGRTPQEKARHKEWTEAEAKGMDLFFDRWRGTDFSQFQIGASM